MTEKNEAMRLADALEDDLEDYAGLSLPRLCQGIADDAAAELRRLHHNNQVLKNALWKACGDDEGVVNDTIASEGELK